MTIIKTKEGILLQNAGELNPEKTFECGQCFRWNLQEDGSYFGSASGRALTVRAAEGGLELGCTEAEFWDFWYDYFDFGRDYEAIRQSVSINDFMTRAADFGEGIRILRQEPWEALCSFIVSQCNNIPRIKGIVERLAQSFGKKLGYRGRDYYSFPSAELVAGLSLEELKPLRAGYRAAYILSAAKMAAEGGLNLEALRELEAEQAMKELTRLEGVGVKVGSCALLFGLHKLETFPVDVWIKRALSKHFPKDFRPEVFGPHAGVAQQYIFHYIRNGEAKAADGQAAV